MKFMPSKCMSLWAYMEASSFNSFILSFIRPLIHSLLHSFTLSFSQSVHLFTASFILLLIHSFFLQLFVVCLLCARQCAKFWERESECTDHVP